MGGLTPSAIAGFRPQDAAPASAEPAARQALQWVLLIEPVGRPGNWNMARDETLLRAVARQPDRAYLRLYCWDPPCLSLGRHEPALLRYDRAAIARLGVDVVRRPTGGRAVWHQHEVTYAVAAPVAALGGLQESYQDIHRRLARGLATLGLPVRLAPRRRLPPGDPMGGACFARAAGGEIVVGDRKLVGSAQVRLGAALLQHGSILLGDSQELVAQLSRQAGPPLQAASLADALGRPADFAEVAQAIAAGWCEPGEVLAPGELPAPSPELIGRYADPAWTWRR